MINATLKRVGPVTDVESARVGSLAISFPMLQRMKVAEIINRHLPADPQLEFDYGRVLTLLAAARFYQPLEEFRRMGIAKVRRLGRKNHVLYDIKYVFKADEVDGRL